MGRLSLRMPPPVYATITNDAENQCDHKEAWIRFSIIVFLTINAGQGITKGVIKFHKLHFPGRICLIRSDRNSLEVVGFR